MGFPLAGTRFILQNLLPVVDDQPLPRSDISIFSQYLAYTFSCRRCYHDYVPCSLWEWVSAYCLNFIHSSYFEWTYNGCIGDHYMVCMILYCCYFSDIISDRHIYMIVSEVVTLFFYIISIAFLPEYFGMAIHFLIWHLFNWPSFLMIIKICHLLFLLALDGKWQLLLP